MFVHRTLDAAFVAGQQSLAQAEQQCTKYEVGSKIPLWYDPRRPHRATLTRLGVMRRLGMLAIGVVLCFWLLPQQHLESRQLAMLAAIWFGLHILLNAIFEVLHDALSVIALARMSVVECRNPESVLVNRDWMVECEREIAAQGFQKLCYLHAPRLQLARHANLDSIWVSRDREIMAVIGDVRFVGKVLGLFGLPFMKHEGVYFCSSMSDGMLLETMRGESAAKIRNRIVRELDANVSVEEMIAAHRDFVDQYMSDSCLDDREFEDGALKDGALKDGALKDGEFDEATAETGGIAVPQLFLTPDDAIRHILSELDQAELAAC